MIPRTFGAALRGVEAFTVTVEVDVQKGLPKFEIVGLAQSEIQEGRNRILSALRNTGFTWSAKRVTVNLAPAAVRKEGSGLDLPIALGLISALGGISPDVLEGTLAVGELSLDGTLRPLRGAIVYADHANAQGWKRLILPYPSSAMAFPNDMEVLAPLHLSELLESLRGEKKCPPKEAERGTPLEHEGVDWNEVGGQEMAKRALEIAAAGHHNILLKGPPGVGKTLLARRFSTILPLPDAATYREIERVHSTIAPDTGRLRVRVPPFRSPHHHASLAGMVGGGKEFRPGEMTLAHGGVLFMDELPEFRRDVLEALREPLEDGKISVSRAAGLQRLPARFLFLGAMNLCPCGALGDPRKSCLCTPPALERYQSRVSGPIRDRIDLAVAMVSPTWNQLWERQGNEASVAVRARVEEARRRQAHRQGEGAWNGYLPASKLKELVQVDTAGEKLLRGAIDRLGLSARGLDKTLRVGRTIADLEGSEGVLPGHIAEALQFRSASIAL